MSLLTVHPPSELASPCCTGANEINLFWNAQAFKTAEKYSTWSPTISLCCVTFKIMYWITFHRRCCCTVLCGENSMLCIVEEGQSDLILAEYTVQFWLCTTVSSFYFCKNSDTQLAEPKDKACPLPLHVFEHPLKLPQKDKWWRNDENTFKKSIELAPQLTPAELESSFFTMVTIKIHRPAFSRAFNHISCWWRL